ncbi:MAG: hypothetical protein JNN20_06205 [Betaproteobacteria bacterium]|nr:hypothetical protein [Betaproteobacteria bacterium]
MRSVVLLALALSACATQTEPPPVVTAPIEQRVATSKYNEAVNADVSCLSTEQQAAYAERQKEMLKKATESMASAMVAARMSGSVGSANASAARDALKQCESNLPADVDKSKSCVAERRNAAISPGVAAIRQAMFASAAERMKEAAALRAEFPPCPAAK